jgi:hypothetical protein
MRTLYCIYNLKKGDFLCVRAHFLKKKKVTYTDTKMTVLGWGPDVSDQTIPGPEYNSLLWPI